MFIYVKLNIHSLFKKIFLGFMSAKLKKNLVIIFILNNSLLLGSECFYDTASYLKNPNYIQELSLYEVYKTKQADIILLGDSNTQGASWNELLGRCNVIQRGIASDVLEGYLFRLDYIIKLKPKVVFIMGGLNDIYNWIPVETIFQNYISIIRHLQSKGIKVVIQSTFFVLESWPSAEDRNKEVQKLNFLLADFSKKEKLVFIDINKKFSNDLFFKKEYTNSWGHLNGAAYKIWADEVEKVLIKLGL